MLEKLYFEKVAIVGVGLIGGSLAISMREDKMAGRITGIGRGLPNLEAAKRLGVVDDFTRDVAEGVKDADLVIVATPVTSIEKVMTLAYKHLKPGAIVTDVGSVKGAIAKVLDALMPEGTFFVPGHPIAGTEHSGVEAAFLGLFENKRCILTPTESTDELALKKVSELWERVGSEVVIMDAERHDVILASISHLPHVIAYALVNTVAGTDGKNSDALKYSAGGFKDFTRIASSSPEMWSDICALNKDAILDYVESFKKTLDVFSSLIRDDDFKGLTHEFERAKEARDSLSK